MQQDTAKSTRKHNLILENRNKLMLSDISDVESFDESMVVAMTSLGAVVIKGENLHISKLNLDIGELCVQGDVFSMVYSDDSDESKSFLSKMFR